MSTVKELAVHRIKPEISLDAKDLPEIKRWSVGKNYTFSITAEMVSLTKSSSEDYDPGIHARFKVIKVKDCDES